MHTWLRQINQKTSETNIIIRKRNCFSGRCKESYTKKSLRMFSMARHDSEHKFRILCHLKCFCLFLCITSSVLFGQRQARKTKNKWFTSKWKKTLAGFDDYRSYPNTHSMNTLLSVFLLSKNFIRKDVIFLYFWKYSRRYTSQVGQHVSHKQALFCFKSIGFIYS